MARQAIGVVGRVIRKEAVLNQIEERAWISRPHVSLLVAAYTDPHAFGGLKAFDRGHIVGSMAVSADDR